MMIEMSENKKNEEFYRLLGYRFKNEMLLTEALTHSSYYNELKIKATDCNERLEFLGDSVIELATRTFLFKKRKNDAEGILSRVKASLVCEKSLAFCARRIKLNEYIKLGKGEKLNNGNNRDSILSDAFEALVAAIYLDSGFEEAAVFVEKNVLDICYNNPEFYDYKTELQELIMAAHDKSLSYCVLEETGPDHERHYKVGAFLGEEMIGSGEGSSKKSAEQVAASVAIRNLSEVR